MIETATIETHLKEILAGAGCFLVDIRVDKSNRILVHLDRDTGVNIKDCVHISRQLESKLDRDIEDFALEVSSPGLDSPFKVIEQYRNSTGKQVRIVLEDGNTFEGLLTEVSDPGITLETGKGQPLSIDFDEIRSAQRIVKI